MDGNRQEGRVWNRAYPVGIGRRAWQGVAGHFFFCQGRQSFLKTSALTPGKLQKLHSIGSNVGTPRSCFSWGLMLGTKVLT